MSTTENINYPVINSILDKNLLKLNVGSSTIDTTPMLTITAKTGSIINVYDGNIFLGKAKEVSDGVFTFTPKKALLIGEHNFSVSYNAKSNIISDVFAIKIVEKIDVDIEKKIPLTLSFTADTGSIVNVYDGEKFLGIATETSTGKFSLVTEFLSEGNHNFYTKIVKTTPPVTVIIDNNLPKSPVLISVKDNNNIPIYNTTDDLTPTFVFSADSKSVVAIYDNDIFLGNAVETDDGIFTFTSEKLNLGNHSISAREINSSGKLSTNSLGYMLTIKNAEPTTTTDNNTENTSSEKMTTLHFTAENGSIVKVYDGNNLLGIATEISPGKFSFILNSLSEGDHSFSAAVTKSTTPFSLFIDKTPPISPVLLNVKDQFGNVINDKTSNTSPIFTFSAETNTLVSIYDGSSLIGQASEITKGVFAFSDATLSLGSHNITAKSMDFSGNMSDISANYLLSIIQNGQNISQTPTLTFNADAGSIVDVYDGKTLLGRAIEISAGKFSFTPTYLSNGNHSFTASIIKSTIPYSVIIDSIAPAAPILAYIKDDLGNTILNKTDDVTPTFTFYAEDSSVVAVYDDKNLLGNATEIAKGIFTFTAPKLTLGDHNITADAVDKSENKSLISDSYKISINGVIQNTTTSTLTFNAEKGSTVSVFDGKKLLGTAVEVSPGTFTYTPTLLAEGSHYFSIMVTKNTLPYVLELDVTAPNAPSILSVIEDSGHTIYSYTEDRTPTFNFSAEPGSALMLYDGTTLLGKATEISSGKFSFTPTSLLTIGNHSVIATAKDKAGNVSNASIPYVFFINEPYVAPIPTNTVEGYIIAGPVLSGNDLSITLYQGDGTTQIGTTGKVDNTGKFSINVGTYTGVVIAKLVNPSGATVDYMDEATGSAKDVTASLMSVGIVTSGTLPLNVNVLTTVAAIKAGVGSRVITSTAVIQANAAVASVFGLTDLTNSSIITTITTTGSLNSDYNPTDSVNNAEKYGAVLAALSGVDANTSMQATIDALTGGLSITGSVGTLDNVTLDAVIVGARVAASKVAGTAASSLTAVVSNAAMKTSNSISINHIATDDVINISEQTTTITGTVFANASVQLTIGRDNNHSVNADGSGNWNYALTPADISAMGQGGETIIVISGGESASRSIVVDTVAPTTTIVTLTVADNVGSITGNLTSGGVTDDTGLVLNGTLGIAILGSDEVIAIYDGATRLGTATVSSNTVGGAWTFVDARTLTNAQAISYTARAEDAAGNQGTASSAFTTTVDTVAPADASIFTPLITNDTTPVISGLAPANTAVTVNFTGATYTVTSDASGVWRLDTGSATPTSGTLSVNANGNNYLGITSPSSINSILVVDTTAPASPVITSSASTNTNTPTITGTAESGAIISAVIGGITYKTTATGGNWSITPNSPLNANETIPITVTATDAAGNVSALPATQNLKIDAVTITSSDSTYSNAPTLTGTAEATSTIAVSIAGAIYKTPSDGSGNWIVDTSLATSIGGVLAIRANENNAVSVWAMDSDGNVSASPTVQNLKVDGIVITSPTSTNSNTPTISGTAEPSALITAVVAGTTYPTTTVAGNGSWSIAIGTLLDNSNNSISVTATDSTGHISSSATTQTLTVDKTPPTISSIVRLGSTTTNLDVLTYRVKFSEDVTGVDTNDFSLAGTTGTISDVTQISGTIYDVTISGGNLASLSSNTSVTLSIASSPTIADIATNTMLTSASSAAFTLSNTVTPSITSTTTHSLGGIAFTDNKTPTLAITAEANSAVMVFDQGTFVGMASGTTNSSSYSFTPSADLWAGKHSFTFKTVDSNHTVLTSSATAYPLYIGEIGETKASDSSHTNNFLFTVDRTSPYSQDITVSSNLANYNFKIGGLNGITGYNKMVYEYIDQDYISHGQSQLQANLTTVNSVSPASEFTEPVQATDSKTVGSVTNTWDVGKLTNSYDFKLKNGNTLLYTSDLLQVNVLSKPAVDSLAPTQPIVTNNSGTLNITAEALSKVLVFDNNAYVGLATEIGTTTAYTFTPSSLSSDHHINVIAIDDAGNVSPIGFVGIY